MNKYNNGKINRGEGVMFDMKIKSWMMCKCTNG